MSSTAAIARQRAHSHRLEGAQLADPASAVAWFGMVQAQDYRAALWAVGLRVQAATEAAVEQALRERRILRTWPARGTLHFVAAADVRWLLQLLAPRAIARSARRFKELELDEAVLARSRTLLTRALQGGRALPREALYQVLEAGRVSPAGQRGIHILGRLAQEGLLCFGARADKQQTFTLLDEWVPGSRTLPREAALAELAARYVAGHGPVTAADLAWWSGLTIADARAGLDLAQPRVALEKIAGQPYWRLTSAPQPGPAARSVQLLPAFDEYLVGYQDRSAVLDPVQSKRINAGGGMLSPVIVLGGHVIGTWRRVVKRGGAVITPAWFASPTPAQARAVRQAAEHYSAFLGIPVTLAEA